MSTPQPQFKRTKAITLPTLSHKKTTTYYLRVMSEIYQGKQLPAKLDKDGKPLPQEKPADCLRVVNLSTGEEGEYLVPTVVRDRLIELGKIEGRCFEVTKLGRRDGKRYDDYAVYEIEDPTPKATAKK